jgi:hypothetical protein
MPQRQSRMRLYVHHIVLVVCCVLFLSLSLFPGMASAGDVIQVDTWVQLPKYRGKLMTVKQGLLIGGGAWTKGRLKNGVLDGNGVVSRDSFDISRGAHARIKFAVSGGGDYMSFSSGFIEGTSGVALSTRKTRNGSRRVAEKKWLYGEVVIKRGGRYNLTIRKNGYDDSEILVQSIGTISQKQARFIIRFSNNYQGPKAGVLIAEAKIVLKGGPKVSLTNIKDSDEYKNFYGLNDKLMAPSLWKPTLKKWARQTCSASKAYQNKKSPTEPFLPGEKGTDRLLIYPHSALFTLAGPGLVSDRSSNVYTRASARYEDVFFERMGRKAPQSMTPRDVMALALKVTNGDYGLAVLTVHYVFKATTYRSRNIIAALVRQRKTVENLVENNPKRPATAKAIRDYRAKYEKGRRLLAQFNSVVRPLVSLRADPGKTPDKMGPWYHIFVLFVIDAYGGGEQALVAGGAEHGAKYLNIFQNEGGYNAEKADIDYIFTTHQVTCIPLSPKTPPKTTKKTHPCLDDKRRADAVVGVYDGPGRSMSTRHGIKGGYVCFAGGSYSAISGGTVSAYSCSKDFKKCKLSYAVKGKRVTNRDGGYSIVFNTGAHWEIKPKR